MISNNYTHLIYVNDPVKFRNTNKHFIITNTKQFEWTFSIDDYNVDALLTVQKIGGEKEALFQLLQFENIVPHINKSIQVETLDSLRLGIITEDNESIISSILTSFCNLSVIFYLMADY